MLTRFQTTASSSVGVVKESATAHVAGGSASDIEKLYPSMPQFLPGDSRHESTVSHAASFRSPSAKTSTARESHQLTAGCAWNSDAAAASTSTALVSSKNQTEVDNAKDAAAAAATVGSVKAALSNSESYHLSQSAVTKERHENHVFTAVEKDLQKSQVCSTFKTAKETCPLPTAEVGLCHSMAKHEGHEGHGQRKCSAGSQPTASSSASTSGASRAGAAKPSSQLQDVEADGNNNKRLASVGRLLGDQETDSQHISARLNCVASSSQAPATSNDAFDVCQSKTNDNAFNDERAASSEQVCSTLSERETAVMDKDGSETATASDGEPSLPTSMSGLDSFHQFLQLEQSSADQQVGFGEFQQQESAGEMELTAGEMEQLLTSFTASGISSDEQIIAAFDIDIPEVPLFQNYMTSDDCPSVEQQLAHAARVREITAEESDSSTGSPAAEIEESKDTVCDEIQAEPVSVTCSADENTYQAISAECPAEEQKNTNADVAFRQAESLYGPLDLTCGRVHSTNNALCPGDVLNTAVVVSSASQDVISRTYGHCAPTNMCSCQTSHPAFSEYCSRWSMVQVTNNYGVGWPPHPYPCCGHPGLYPGPPHSPMFPGLPCSCHGTQPVRARARSRGGGTGTRRRPVQNSCSRVDGIRSTKVRANGDPSLMKDGVPCASGRPRSVPATGIQSQDVCASGGEVSKRPSSTSSVDTVITAPTSGWNGCDLPAPQEVDVLSAAQEVNNPPTECNLPAPQEVGLPPSAVATSEANATAFPVDVMSEANATAAPVVSRGRGGRRRGGRAPRSSAASQPRASVTEPDSGTQPVVRGRRRGRPRKHRDGPTTGDRTSQVQNSGVDPRTEQVHHPRNDGGGPASAAAKTPVNDTASAPVRGSRRPRTRRIKVPAGVRSPVRSDQVAGSAYPPGPTDVERPKTCETLHLGTLTPPVDATGGTPSTSSRPGIHCVAHPAHAPTHCGNHTTAATSFGNCGGASTCPTAADHHHHHHHHHFPLMPPPSGSPADSMLCGPVATSGAIIRKPRSRKQGSRNQSNTTTPENTPGKDAPDGASPAVSGVGAAGESPVSWQPLATESAISSLLDTLSVASSDHEGTETSLTSCGIRLQTSPSIPFVVLERADLSRCAVRPFHKLSHQNIFIAIVAYMVSFLLSVFTL